MLINLQGYGHFTNGLNNQDFGIELPKMLLVLDGCSGGKYSEVGTRLFAQLFSRKEECDKVAKFENNVKDVFEEILSKYEEYYPVRKDFEDEFIMENLLFTTIACFETDEQFIVKLFGDGYIFTQNNRGAISYMRFSYGKYPPYYAYKYCDLSEQNLDYSKAEFKTFYLDKKIFKKVGIASDGILPIAKGDIPNVDKFISDNNDKGIEVTIKARRQMFTDDVTLGMIGGN